MSLVNSDENKTFGVVLRTPVENSKGIPHILEHSVLCGSRKYPIKEPFVELMKVRQRGQLMRLSVKCVSVFESTKGLAVRWLLHQS